jgi:hypothetical protein
MHDDSVQSVQYDVLEDDRAQSGRIYVWITAVNGSRGAREGAMWVRMNDKSECARGSYWVSRIAISSTREVTREFPPTVVSKIEARAK